MGAWQRIDRAIAVAAQYGFGVLIGWNPQCLLHSSLTSHLNSSIQICTPHLVPKIVMLMLGQVLVASNSGSTLTFVRPSYALKSCSVTL